MPGTSRANIVLRPKSSRIAKNSITSKQDDLPPAASKAKTHRGTEPKLLSLREVAETSSASHEKHSNCTPDLVDEWKDPDQAEISGSTMTAQLQTPGNKSARPSTLAVPTTVPHGGSLVVRLKLPQKLDAVDNNIAEKQPVNEQAVSGLQCKLKKKRPPKTAFNVSPSISNILTISPPLPANSGSPPTWTDHITPFSTKAIRSTLLGPEEQHPQLPPHLEWFASAVPASAIFPPGTPLTASEINAYYPHHIRWIDVMLRLAHNGYKGHDMLGVQSFFRGNGTPPLTKAQANQVQRDLLKNRIPGFSTVEGAWEGVPNANLSTAELDPGQVILNRLNGRFTAPTFDELVRGLTALPEGDSARELTTCLLWWLQEKDNFTPQLDFNVLHVPWLVRALRTPLPPYGSRNLDREALLAWRTNGHLPSTNITNKKPTPKHQAAQTTPPSTPPRSRLEANLKTETITPTITLQLRNILLLPYMSMRNMATTGIATLLLNDPDETPPLPSPQTPSSTTTLSAEQSPTEALLPTEQPPHPSPSPTAKTSPPTNTLSFEDALRGYRIPLKRRHPVSAAAESLDSQSLRKKIARDALERRRTQELDSSPLSRRGNVDGESGGSNVVKRGHGKENVEDGDARSPETSPLKRVGRVE